DVMSLRQACLDQRLAGLRALARELADQPSQALVEKADGPASELEPLSPCANIALLRQPELPPPDPRIPGLVGQLVDGRAQLITARYLPALVTSAAALELSKQIGYLPLEAEAYRVRGAALFGAQNTEDAV